MRKGNLVSKKTNNATQTQSFAKMYFSLFFVTILLVTASKGSQELASPTFKNTVSYNITNLWNGTEDTLSNATDKGGNQVTLEECKKYCKETVKEPKRSCMEAATKPQYNAKKCLKTQQRKCRKLFLLVHLLIYAFLLS